MPVVKALGSVAEVVLGSQRGSDGAGTLDSWKPCNATSSLHPIASKTSGMLGCGSDRWLGQANQTADRECVEAGS